MKIVFAGTPDFAAAALARLLAAGFEVPLVLSQPDRPSGRGMRVESGAVKKVALAAGIEVMQPVSLKRDRGAVERLRATPHDAMVVAAYGLILPQEVLDIPPLGCLNIHASLLPRWRGAAPVQRAILAGDRESGICIMRMEAGLDTGPVLLSRRMPIGATDTAATLTGRLASLGADSIVDALNRLDDLEPVPQNATGVTYAAKIDRSEAPLDFRAPAPSLEHQVRAFNPFPGASVTLDGQLIKVWAAHAVGDAAAAAPGGVVNADASGIAVACAAGTLVITELQRPGAKRLPARDFLSGFPLSTGSRFELPHTVET